MLLTIIEDYDRLNLVFAREIIEPALQWRLYPMFFVVADVKGQGELH